MHWEETFLRLLSALILSSLVGFERQFHQRTAGLRTNMLVSLGSTAFTIFGVEFVEGESVSRVVAQIVSGIGFLGAGSIMREGFNIHGLNTAATLWCGGALGVFCGVGLHLKAFIFTFFIILTNTLLRRVELYMERRSVVAIDADVLYSIDIVCEMNHNRDVRETLIKRMRHRHFSLKQMQIIMMDDKDVTLRCVFKTKGSRDQSIEQVVEDLVLDPDIQSVQWSMLGSSAER